MDTYTQIVDLSNTAAACERERAQAQDAANAAILAATEALIAAVTLEAGAALANHATFHHSASARTFRRPAFLTRRGSDDYESPAGWWLSQAYHDEEAVGWDASGNLVAVSRRVTEFTDEDGDEVCSISYPTTPISPADAARRIPLRDDTATNLAADLASGLERAVAVLRERHARLREVSETASRITAALAA